MNILMIIAQKDFRDEEYLVPKESFEKAGLKVIIASVEKGACLGKLGAKVTADISFNDVNVADYDAVVFVGGYGAHIYFDNKKAHEIARETLSSGKIISAICIAPMTLVMSGILKGKKATVFPSEAENMKNKGVNYTGADVETDGNIVTGNGPDAAGKFADKIINLLTGV